jgi:DNA polymerase III epsilon subunit-like protein
MINPVFYICDTETTGLDPVKHSPIEVCYYRIQAGYEDKVKTSFIKAINYETIDHNALRINGHKFEDITHQTAVGRAKYIDPHKAIVDMENFIAEDNLSNQDRIFVGHNGGFDYLQLQKMWEKCDCLDSFPFGRLIIDTRQFELLCDLAQNKHDEAYNLGSVLKRYGIKNEKAHTAEADCIATAQLFKKQLESFNKLILKNV